MSDYYCLDVADATKTPAERSVLDAYMALRLDYVLGMGWLDSIQSDRDVYDDTPRTRYCVRLAGESRTRGGEVRPRGGAGRRPRGRDATGRGPRNRDPFVVESMGPVAAGLRLTQVDSVHESLTWSMFDSSPAVQRRIDAEQRLAIAELDRCARRADRGLWDITRLVAPLDGSVSGPEIIRSIHELIGMAVYSTVIADDADPAWIFLTTAHIKRLFDASGIGCEVIYSGSVTPTDPNQSFLCMTRPKAAYERMSQSPNLTHRRAFQRVVDGCEALTQDRLLLAG